MGSFFLHEFIIEDYVKSALKEDIGFGDISTDFICEDCDFLSAKLNTRTDGVLCGSQVFEKVFRVLHPAINIEFYKRDGELIKKGETIASVKGQARYILTGERTALNFIQRMSGIATETRKYQDAIAPYVAKIVDTRKTTPNFRLFEKYSVKVGSGGLHRFNLCDCVMLKDNHIKLIGSISEAVKKVRKSLSHAHKIEVECDTLEQVQEALDSRVEIIMLDNMSLEMMKKAVGLIDKKAIIEASGGVTLKSVNAIASSGVDIISSSSIVAGALALDLGLDIL